MESRVCMNGSCGASASSSVEWKKGWPLRSGEFATLCDKCGTAYEQLVLCETFHSEDTGWRECTSCGKRLHCGCIASINLIELLDVGGVNCISCSKRSGSHHLRSTQCDEKPKSFGLTTAPGAGEAASTPSDKQCSDVNHELEKLKLLGTSSDNDGQKSLKFQNEDPNGSLYQMKQEDCLASMRDAGSSYILSLSQTSIGSSYHTKLDVEKETAGANDAHGSLGQTNLTISLAAPSGNPNPFVGLLVGERELNKMGTSFQQGPRSHHLLPKTPKSILASGAETNASVIPQIRVARPPVEGRIKNQLLPRYWPRITDQELQQISGDSNTTIVPLFEKVLSASDAGRIGRLVLPKACAEAYFPPISQPEGLPLRIQDVKGKEWVFQFRFWPNNNSRMYVLEGVTPCIQSMQLQAGDTVTFSRMDPEGKLIMGFRKASATITMQETHLSSIPNGAFSSELLGSIENVPIMGAYSGLQPRKGNTDTSLNTLSRHIHNGDLKWHISENYGDKMRDGPFNPSLQSLERKKIRNIGSKSKRLLMDSLDALELKLSWDEVQDMFRPPPSVKPTTVAIEDYIFEEYEEPPVFGKRSIFTLRLSGEQEQWAQCDSCFKWRRVPADFLFPPKWTCQDNIWDQSRYSCSAPEELGPRELEILLKMNKEFKRQKTAASHRSAEEPQCAGLDAPTNGIDTSDPGATSVAVTTKHPRHRPGCSCIVCIQPPSGKGKHKPTCTCNVCMTVKRRFKTLMMRKKKRQSELEAEIAQRSRLIWSPKEEVEVDSIARQVTLQHDSSENGIRLEAELQSRSPSHNGSQKFAETAKGQLDLNCHPDRDDLHMGTNRVSMMSLLQEAALPLEKYLRQNGLTSLVSDQQASSGSHAPPQTTGESEERVLEDCSPANIAHEQEIESDDELCGPDQTRNDL